MRRHYRNHAAPGVPRNQNSAESRRRRKRGDSQNLVFVPGGNPASYPPGSPTFLNSSFTTTSRVEESSDGSDYDDEDELDTPSDNLTPVSATLRLPWEASKNIFGSYAEKDHPAVHSAANRYSQSHLRSGHPSNPTSPTGTPPLGHCTYIPSAPYSQSFADKKVSTALRPAFHAQSVLGRNAEEAMSF
ncbi:hypothetical protein H0H93_002162 [Arthromyces matolae]|nr:hypothetical protein H0H93_002162 [Arthromyces matolae]